MSAEARARASGVGASDAVQHTRCAQQVSPRPLRGRKVEECSLVLWVEHVCSARAQGRVSLARFVYDRATPVCASVTAPQRTASTPPRPAQTAGAPPRRAPRRPSARRLRVGMSHVQAQTAVSHINAPVMPALVRASSSLRTPCRISPNSPPEGAATGEAVGRRHVKHTLSACFVRDERSGAHQLVPPRCQQ